MSDPRISKLADLLVNYSVEVKRGDWVAIAGDVAALPLIDEVTAAVLRAGGNPTSFLSDGRLQATFFREASDEQLAFVSPVERLVTTEADVTIYIGAPGNTRTLSNVDPRKQQVTGNAYRDLMKLSMERSASGAYRWTYAQYPCPALAQDADMSLREYTDFVFAATFADQPDPVQCWLDIHNMQQRLVNWLKGKEKVRVTGPNVDLTLSIAGRTFINSDGKKNMPSGEIFTGPVEDSVNGWVKFTYPAIQGGREVEGVALTFKDGKVTEARAAKNEAYLLSQLDSDAGARYLGEFAIGTNFGIQKFTKSILYDEKIGGTMHMALGAGYPETGSKNESAIHWDMICDMRQESEIWVDDELFYRNGQFQVLE